MHLICLGDQMSEIVPPPDENPAFWQDFPHEDLALRTAALHAQRRELSEKLLSERVHGARYAVACQFISGKGLEVGAGNRPVPVPSGASVGYGDIRDSDALRAYFSDEIAKQGFIDAQTFKGVPDRSQDFVISGHVIEHLLDPIGSIENAMRVVRDGGCYMIIVPDMRHTFDRTRPATPLAHFMADWRDGGAGTKLAAHEEWLRYCFPVFHGHSLSDEEITRRALEGCRRNDDIHYHTWTFESFLEMLRAIEHDIGFAVVCSIPECVNENIYVIRKAYPT